MINALPNVDYLNECFVYDSIKGLLLWKHRPSHHFPSDRGMNIFNRRFSGQYAGNTNSDGYYVVSLSYAGKRIEYKASRVIWKMHTGNDPFGEIDHRNRDRSDNHFDNLRDASDQQNRFNGLRHDGSLLTGVRMNGNKFQAQAGLNGKKHYLGNFDTEEEAHEAYLIFAKEHHGEFFNG